jgi:hypothetical protein
MKSRSLAYPHAARDIVDLIEEAARRASPKRLGRT